MMARAAPSLLLAAGLVLLLEACASDADFRHADEAACTSYGFTPGSDGFAACLQREALARRYPPLWSAPVVWHGAGFYAGALW